MTKQSRRKFNIDSGFKSSENNMDFSEENGITTIKYATLTILEMMIERGFRERFVMTMNNQENLLTTLSKQ